MRAREALIQRIIDAPDDDAPRLAFAGWQKKHGDPVHAELIGVQCRLARLAKGDPKRDALKKRQAELLKRPEFKALTRFDNKFTRGFVESANWYDGEDNFDFGGVPLDRVLSLEAADFGDSNWPDAGVAARMAAAPWARRIRRIAFHEFGTEPAVVRALAASPHLTNLREVVFNDCTTAPDALADLLLGPSVCGVEVVLLQGDSGGWDGLAGSLRRVLADPRAGRLRHLHLLAAGLPADIVDVLLGVTGLEGLQLSLGDRLPWLTDKSRAALRDRFGAALTFEWGLIDPYFFTRYG